MENLSRVQEGLREVEAPVLRSWLERREAVLVDVREPAEHASERIEGSALHPLSSFDPRSVPGSDGRKLVLYCRTGNRSGQAGRRRLADGFAEVHHLRGGAVRGRRGGLPGARQPEHGRDRQLSR